MFLFKDEFPETQQTRNLLHTPCIQRRIFLESYQNGKPRHHHSTFKKIK